MSKTKTSKKSHKTSSQTNTNTLAHKHQTGAEWKRLEEDNNRKVNWKRFGPYLSERQWATVREDYSADGSVWDYFPHDQARSRAYRWGEDGLLGFSDRESRLCFSIALWNGKDSILKERMFGLTGPEGNHGEDVKELYYYLDSTPTHSYAKALYKYPQNKFPYKDLVDENRRRSQKDDEYELIDTGIFDESRYFDVQAEYAKNSANDILTKITITNHGPDKADLHLLPTLWFRNTWRWGNEEDGITEKPTLEKSKKNSVIAKHQTLGEFEWMLGSPDKKESSPELLFTENDSNNQLLFDTKNDSAYVKDGFHHRVINDDKDATNPSGQGTKAAGWYKLSLESGQSKEIKLRLCKKNELTKDGLGEEFDKVFDKRIKEADEFYKTILPEKLNNQQKKVSRQAYAGLLWSKQFYYYVVKDWLKGDPNEPAPPKQHENGRNKNWKHMYCRDVLSMPDKWEYPWFAAWDLAFHTLSFAQIDPAFTKRQLIRLLREWYLHPNGQMPAYEFAFSDVNPPVHAYACWRVYKQTAPKGKRDREFLASAFQKLLLNFTWWVNRKDPSGENLFSGGFLGLDNIGVFDRNKPLPSGHSLNQSDGTAWMAFYCSTMLSMALELAEEKAYEDMASKFFEHFIHIVDAMNSLGGTGLWDKEDGFYYDQLNIDGDVQPIKVRSLVGLMPLIAVQTFPCNYIENLKGFWSRVQWFTTHRPDLAANITYMEAGEKNNSDVYMLALPKRDKLRSVLKYMLDPNEFLSDFGIRSLSKIHEQHPYRMDLDGQTHEVKYEPAESHSGMFGGNSNWRGPIWFPVNFIIIEALRRYHRFYGDDFKVECPTGSGNMMSLDKVAVELEGRLASIFSCDKQGNRPCHGREAPCKDIKGFEDLILFHEYFNGETGHGLGASHQTGWTALITRCYEKMVS